MYVLMSFSSLSWNILFFCRDAAPANGKTSELIKETIDLTRNDRIHLKNLKSLQQV